ncbi:ester cyclase [Sulfitobacter sp. D35]|uniref:ester cyclase n=1 Tax=Sulfitobacter sp. D35 TaxID=3083252 RepID=UPI00296EE2C3|nr:ester cyclase [Sulfitobacter sp. D35]MDW4499319.1 ester cyclase [Sulfitobacter sp. D35]
MTKSPLEIVKAMEAALERNDDDLSPYFHDDFKWVGSYGCGTKHGLAEFDRAWHIPFREAFHDCHFVTEHFMEDGDWAACFGHCEAVHGGALMGVPATGKRVRIPYIDFWRIRDGKIAENRVSCDLAAVLAQVGHDVFAGQGWEHKGGASAMPSLSFA